MIPVRAELKVLIHDIPPVVLRFSDREYWQLGFSKDRRARLFLCGVLVATSSVPVPHNAPLDYRYNSRMFELLLLINESWEAILSFYR